MIEEGNELEFRCRECNAVIVVNASMRAALLENGCVVCGAAVDAKSFFRPAEDGLRS